MMRVIECIVCGIEFSANHPKLQICSKACRKERGRQEDRRYKERHREHVREQKRHYREIHREQIREYRKNHPEQQRRSEAQRKQHAEYMRDWRAINLEKAREIGRRSYYARHETQLERAKQYYQDNRARKNDYSRERRNANPERFRAMVNRKAAEYRSAVEVFRQLIGPCSYDDRVMVNRILQQLGGNP